MCGWFGPWPTLTDDALGECRRCIDIGLNIHKELRWFLVNICSGRLCHSTKRISVIVCVSQNPVSGQKGSLLMLYFIFMFNLQTETFVWSFAIQQFNLRILTLWKDSIFMICKWKGANIDTMTPCNSSNFLCQSTKKRLTCLSWFSEQISRLATYNFSKSIKIVVSRVIHTSVCVWLPLPPNWAI